MDRPKTGKPPKRSLNLTVDEKTREVLTSLSEQRGMSISALVEEWAANEAQKTEQLIQRAAEHPDIHRRAVHFLKVFQRAQASEFFQPDVNGFMSALEDLEKWLKDREGQEKPTPL